MTRTIKAAAACFVAAVYLSGLATKTSALEINLTIHPGEKFALGNWVAQQPLDVTGANKLLGDSGTPDPDSVRVHECDESGRIVRPRPSQFDLESKNALPGILSWSIESMAANQPRHFRITWGEQASEKAVEPEDSSLHVNNTADTCVVSNRTYQVTHDKKHGGLWSRLEFRPSGKSTDKTVWRDGLCEYELRNDSSPQFRVISAGPLRAVIEVKARYLNTKGEAPPSRPRATYRYTYLAGLHYVHIETTIEQDEAVDWPELRIGDLLPDFDFFPQYWMDHYSGKHWNNYRDLRHMGSFTTLYNNHALLLGQEAYFCFAGPMVRFWDAGKTPGSYLRAHWKPWRTKRMRYAFYAQLDGSANGKDRIVARAHTFHQFANQFLHSMPPHVALDVEPLQKKALKLLSPFQRKQSELSELPWVRRAVANFSLRQARTHLTNGNVSLHNGAFGRVSELFKAATQTAKNTIFTHLSWKPHARQGNALGLETDGLLILINKDMALAIDREELKLRGLLSAATNKEFVLVSETAPAPELFGLTLLDSDRNEFNVSEITEAKRSHTWRQGGEDITLVLRWQGLDVARDSGVIDVEGTVSIGPEGMSRWSCRVKNRSGHLGLRAIKFPVIGPLHAGTREDPTDYNSNGKTNPTVKTGQVGIGRGYYGARGGVYLHPRDPQWYKKIEKSQADATTRTARYEHSYIAVNSHGEQVQSFDASYEVAVGVFEGDWYDIARIYRRWAVKQPWCAKGTIAQREDLPQWFKNVDFFDQGSAYTPELFDAALHLGRNHNRVEGHHGPIGIWMTHWMQHKFDNKYPDYFPPLMGKEDFKSSIAEAHKLGMYTMPYINAFIYATNAPSFTEEARKNTSLTFDGMRRGGRIQYGEKNMPYVWMCPATKFWQNKIAEIGREIIQEYDCDGMYYDQIHVSGEECADPAHGHPVGGGNSRIEGMRELYDRVRRESLAAGKKIVFSSEYRCEELIGTCDMALQQYSGAYTRGHFIEQVIYHDYLATYGYALLSQPFYPYTGSLYMAGVYGPTGLSGKNRIGGEEPNREQLEFIHYLSKCRQLFGVKYLNLGARLRDPVILTELRLIDRGQRRDGSWMPKMPAVITSAWEAGDGDIGCFFMNVSEERQEFDYEIDLSRFALDSMGNYSVTRREPGQDTILHEGNPGKVKAHDTLDRHRLFLIEFKKR